MVKKLSYNKKIKHNNEIPEGFKLRCLVEGFSSGVNGIAWSPDGQILAIWSGNQTIRLWRLETRQFLQTFRGRFGSVNCIGWSPDSHILATGSFHNTIQLWNIETGQLFYTLTGHISAVNSVAWSPDGHTLASGSSDKTIRLWDTQTEQLIYTLEHSDSVNSVAWSPDGHTLASGSSDKTIRLWDTQTGNLIHTLTSHTGQVSSVAWSPDGYTLASGSEDETILVFDSRTGHHKRTLEGHTGPISFLSFSNKDGLLASQSIDTSVRLWDSDTWIMLAVLKSSSNSFSFGLAFNPSVPVLATLKNEGTAVCIWDLDIDAIFNNSSITPSISYTNAKVVLVGDSGVGKSGLGLVLSGNQFVPTTSTHGRRVWIFDHQEVELLRGRKEIREILLWDLAGQPGYRLIHQLHLNEVAVALVIFDAHSETDPFAGVNHWQRALRQAQRIQDITSPLFKKFLVQARLDRGGIVVSPERIMLLKDELEFDQYFETSAKEGRNINELRFAIREAIDWETLPKVSSTDLFQSIKDFLITEKVAGRLLPIVNDLYHSFLRLKSEFARTQDLYAQFETCIGRLEAVGLIKQLSFGKLVLLQPELLDSYASSLINTVRDEPDGLGYIVEERVRNGNFHMPEDERIKDKDQEKLLLIAMTEDLLRRELALREGSFLVFPSQSTRENSDLPGPEGNSVIFSFEGPVLNIYVTLAVRLSNSGLFKKKELWKNAITYSATAGGICGIHLVNEGEGRGELTLFFDEEVSEQTCFHFEEYVQVHLQRLSLPDSLQRRRVFACIGCGTIIPEYIINERTKRLFNWLNCPVCDKRLSILDREERLKAFSSSRVLEMDSSADMQRDLSVAKSTIQGKKESNDFDVFFCYNEEDKIAVRRLAKQLLELGILPWFDEWELRPGLPWQEALEQQINKSKSAAVFVGQGGIGPWQRQETNALLREFVERECPVIPILLHDAPEKPQLPLFLKGLTWIDFRVKNNEPKEKNLPDPMNLLIWGITGKRDLLR